MFVIITLQYRPELNTIHTDKAYTYYTFWLPCPLDRLQFKSPGFGTHSPLAVHTTVISRQVSHLKVASDPSITLVKLTEPLAGLGGTPQVAVTGQKESSVNFFYCKILIMYCM